MKYFDVRPKALITGSSSGLGRALAVHLGSSGCEVTVHRRRNLPGAEEAAEAIRDAGGRAHILSGDVARPAEAKALAEEAALLMSGLNVLINNAGEFLPGYPDEISPEQWDRQIASTVSAAFYVSRAALPALRKGGGRIINIADSRADRIVASPRTLPYQVGKTGVLILTRTLALTEARHGITVNAVLPGVLENSDPPGEARKIPAGRLGNFEDIIGAADYLLGPEAGYVTGAFLQAGGGWNL